MKEMQRNVGEESVGKERHQIQLCSRPGNKSVQMEQVRRLKKRLLQNEINKIPNRFEFIEKRFTQVLENMGILAYLPFNLFSISHCPLFQCTVTLEYQLVIITGTMSFLFIAEL